jgi:hypothetical protein
VLRTKSARCSGDRPVGGHLQIEHDLGSTQHLDGRSAGFNLIGEFHDAAVVAGQAEFVLRAQHAQTFNAPDFGFFQFGAVREHRSHRRIDRIKTHPDVRSAADHLHGGVRTEIHRTQSQPVRVGVGGYFQTGISEQVA